MFKNYYWPLFSFLFLLSLSSQGQSLKRYEVAEPHMGTTFNLIFYAPSDSLAQLAADSAFGHVEYLNSILSDYETDSNLNRLSRRSGSSAFIPVVGPLFHVISKAQQISRDTNGAFDITVGPFVRLWRKIRRKAYQRLPSSEVLNRYQKRVGYEFIKIDSSTTSIALTRPNMQLDLGAIAKGYAADEMLRILRQHNICAALVDAGGDIRMGNPPPGEKGWTVRIPGHYEDGSSHRLFLRLANKAVATSGDLFQHVEINGRRYSHIVDPRTGLGLTNQSMVTVIAPTGLLADSYASAVSVMGAEKGLSLIRSKENFAARIEFREAGGISVKETKRFGYHTVKNSDEVRPTSKR